MDTEDRNKAAVLKNRGYGIIPPDQYLIDLEEDFIEIWNRVSVYTMTSIERGYALYKAVKYISDSGIEGDFVECGVWKGGSCMLMALTLRRCGDAGRKIWLYDTFTGMPEPGEKDNIAWNGRNVRGKWLSDREGRTDNFTSWAVTLESVRANISETGYPPENLEFIEGPVEETLNISRPGSISLLRLDTDWYESTKTELELLFPSVSQNGVLIIDDYGHFTGARAAVDEYIEQNRVKILLNRIDYTGRIGIKS